MPEYQVSQVLENPDATLDELMDSLQDMASQFGYISAMAGQGLRGDSEADLVRTLLIIKVLKLRIYQKVQLS